MLYSRTHSSEKRINGHNSLNKIIKLCLPESAIHFRMNFSILLGVTVTFESVEASGI